jgi:hypothetical protein
MIFEINDENLKAEWTRVSDDDWEIEVTINHTHKIFEEKEPKEKEPTNNTKPEVIKNTKENWWRIFS